MTKINLNRIAQEVTIKEGKKKSISIAQVKEVMKVLLQTLAQLDVISVGEILKKYRK